MKGKTTSPSLIFTLFIAAVILNINFLGAQPLITLNTFSSTYSAPVGIYNCGDDRLFVMEQLGYVYICDLNGIKNPVPYMDIHARVNQSLGEQGMLGMAFHPDYLSNGFIYVNYINLSGNSVVSRFTRNISNINRIDETTEVILMTVTQPYANHNGGCMHFGKDGYLYIGFGDGGSSGDPGNRAQNDLEKLGKILRIDVNSGSPYSIPVSNPYYGITAVLQEIWAKGLRNPWRWSFDSYTGDMWIGDVGQNLYEEISYQPAGSTGGINYGWRCYEGNHLYNNSSNCPASSALTFPVYEYLHGTSTGCSVTGGYVYRGGLNGDLFGKYIFSDYCSGLMRMIEKTGTSSFIETDLNDLANYEISSFGEDKNGELYVCFISSGLIKKLSSSGCKPTAFIKAAPVITPCAGTVYQLDAVYGAGLTYQWYKNNILIAGANSPSYATTSSGTYKVIVTKPGGCSAVSNKVKVTFSPSAVITANGPLTFCAGGSVMLSSNSGSGLSYQWKRNNIAIAGATGINYVATQAGNYKVKVTNSNGCTKNSATITVVVNCKLAEQVLQSPLSIDLVPNPAVNNVNFSLHGLSASTYNVTIYDLIGKKVDDFRVTTSDEGAVSHMIDVSNFKRGIFNVIVTGENGRENKKLVIQ